MITVFALVSLFATPTASGHLKSSPLIAGCASGYSNVKLESRVGFTPLGARPDAHLEIAVDRRTLGGCPAPLIVRYNVSRKPAAYARGWALP